MKPSPDPDREMALLEHIEYDPNVTQASLAAQLGVAVGTVNWHLKRMVAKGYVKVKRAQRRKLNYIITPEGIAFRARLTVNYVEQSLRLYRRVRQRVRDELVEVKRAGFNSVRIQGDGDIADICRLTCLEQGVLITEAPDVPVLEVRDTKVELQLDGLPLRSGPFQPG
ncbi:MAG TPA: winged helix-turn-helix transcriptional regulator [Anaerolineales bacterium]|nr:winged helix-turn-helix transcriptional regulator [Anaerolineales bacterium]